MTSFCQSKNVIVCKSLIF